MSCEECRQLQSHEFRSIDDLVHAVQTAAAEVDRGVLRRVRTEERTHRVSEAVDAALASNAVPGRIHFWFECTVCGDGFELLGDTNTGAGHWSRLQKA